jgi:hypothetical protein
MESIRHLVQQLLTLKCEQGDAICRFPCVKTPDGCQRVNAFLLFVLALNTLRSSPLTRDLVSSIYINVSLLPLPLQYQQEVQKRLGLAEGLTPSLSGLILASTLWFLSGIRDWAASNDTSKAEDVDHITFDYLRTSTFNESAVSVLQHILSSMGTHEEAQKAFEKLQSGQPLLAVTDTYVSFGRVFTLATLAIPMAVGAASIGYRTQMYDDPYTHYGVPRPDAPSLPSPQVILAIDGAGTFADFGTGPTWLDLYKLDTETCTGTAGRLNATTDAFQVHPFLRVGSLNISRAQMPQVSMATADMIAERHYNLTGIRIQNERTTMQATSLLASQGEALISKVQGMIGAYERFLADTTGEAKNPLTGGSPIVVSNDGYVIDGHHRWAAIRVLINDGKLPADTTTEIYRVDLPASRVLVLATQVDGTQYVDVFNNTMQTVHGGRLMCSMPMELRN